MINEKSTFEAIFSAATLGIIVVDEAGKILQANPYAAQLFGYSPSELIGQAVEILIPVAAHSIHVSHRKKYMADPRPRLMGKGRELFGLRKDGAEFAIEISLSHTEIEGEKVTISFISDVTERTKKAKYLLALETAVEKAATPIAFAELDNRISYVNQAFIEKWGYDSKTELIGRYPGEFSASMEKVDEIMKTLHREGSWEGEDVARKKDGTLFATFVNTKLIRDRNDNPLRIMATFVDISNIKEKERALQKQKESAQTYLEMAGSIIVVINKNEEVNLINREGAAALGYEEEEIVGKNWFEHFVPEPNRDALRQVFQGILKEELSQLVHYENEIVDREGQYKLIRWYNRVLNDENGHPVATISSGMDITQTRRIEKELEQSRAQLKRYATELEEEVKKQTLELALNQTKLKQANKLAKIGYWEIDLEDEPRIFWSEEYYQLYEVEQNIKIEDRRYFLQFVHPDDRAKVVSTTKKAIKEGKDISFDYRITTPTQKKKYLRTELHCQKDDEGVVKKVFSVVQDFTEQKYAEHQLEQALKKERDVGLLKSRFVSMASHEFRTPLTSILASAGLIDMYRERGMLDKQIKHVQRIKSSVDNLTSILNDFLSLEKLESGKIQFKTMPIDLLNFIAEVREEVSLMRKGQIIEHQHEGDNIAEIDPHLVKNILINLLSNAIKYSAETEAVQLITEKKNGSLKIQVIDRGIGIPEEEQRQLFSRFFRASNANTIQGTGLGLTIVKRYIDLMNGSISFTSQENEGTTFVVEIPQADTPAP